MTKKQILFLAMGLLVVAFGFTISYLKLKSDDARKVTFEECEKAGGTAWRVDLYQPDICPACAEYRACQEKNKDAADIRQVCPQIASCTECLERNFPYPDRCPDGLKKIGEISDAEIWFQCCQ